MQRLVGGLGLSIAPELIRRLKQARLQRNHEKALTRPCATGLRRRRTAFHSISEAVLHFRWKDRRGASVSGQLSHRRAVSEALPGDQPESRTMRLAGIAIYRLKLLTECFRWMLPKRPPSATAGGQETQNRPP